MENQQAREEEVLVTLELEDGSSVECVVLTLFEVRGKEYAALMPKDEEDEEDPEVVFYRYIEDENEEGLLESIEDDEEYEIVEDAFDELLDTIEYEQMPEEE